jgi:hypothetical protein
MPKTFEFYRQTLEMVNMGIISTTEAMKKFGLNLDEVKFFTLNSCKNPVDQSTCVKKNKMMWIANK